MQTITKPNPSVKQPRDTRLVGWIVKIDGRRVQVPATFDRILGLMPSILPGNVKREAVRS